MASISVAAKIADEIGASTDEVFQALRNVDDQEATARFLAGRGERVAHTAAGTFAETAADQPARITETALGAGQKTLLGAGTIAGGTFLGSEFLQTEQQRLERLARQDQSAALQEILNDPHLTSQDKQNLVDRLMSQGFFQSPSQSSGGDGGGGGLFGNLIGGLFGNLGLVEFLILLLLVYFGGKALVAAADSRGGASGGGS